MGIHYISTVCFAMISISDTRWRKGLAKFSRCLVEKEVCLNKKSTKTFGQN